MGDEIGLRQVASLESLSPLRMGLVVFYRFILRTEELLYNVL